jgi:hypothetical protein
MNNKINDGRINPSLAKKERRNAQKNKYLYRIKLD